MVGLAAAQERRGHGKPNPAGEDHLAPTRGATRMAEDGKSPRTVEARADVIVTIHGRSCFAALPSRRGDASRERRDCFNRRFTFSVTPGPPWRVPGVV